MIILIQLNLKGGNKMNKKRLVICIEAVALLLIFSILSSAAVFSQELQIEKQTNIKNKIFSDITSTYVYTVTFGKPSFKEIVVNDKTFTKIHLPGSTTVGNIPGTPQYQVYALKLLLPQGTDVTKFNVITKTVKIDTIDEGIDFVKNPVLPYQAPVPIGKSPSEFKIDQKAYKSADRFPEDIYDEPIIGYCRGYEILTVNLYPIQYNAADGILFYHPTMNIEINLEKNGHINRFYRNNPADRAWVKSLVINPEILDTYDSKFTDSYEGGLCNPGDNNDLGYDYVIITTDALSNFTGTTYNWDDLISKKKADGLEATKVTVEDIVSCPAYWNTSYQLFNDTPAKIREFCKDAYLDWGTQYILIGGDNDATHPFTRVERRLLHYGGPTSPYPEDVDSDLYWTNLDSTFNEDHDNQWGEIGDGGFDLYSEMYSGSIPCDTGADISNWLTKNFCYANSVLPYYLDNAAFYGGDTTWACEGDDIIDYSAIKGTDDWLGPDPHSAGPYPSWIGFQYGFETWNEHHPDLPFNLSVKWTGEPTNLGWQGGTPSMAKAGLREAINNDKCTLISAIAHANPSMSMDVSVNIWESKYHNTKPFFVTDMGCHCGDMDAADDGVLHSMLFHSDTELAFACIYNTGYGWGEYYSTNSSSCLQQKTFWDYFFDITNNSKSFSNWTFGKAQQWSKDFMAPTINWEPVYDVWRGTIECCLLFGDPAEQLKPPIPLEHNIGISSVTPLGHIKSNKPIHVNVTLFNDGQNDESNVTINFIANGTKLDTMNIPFFEAGTTQNVSFIWTPSADSYTVVINVSALDGETYFDDNENSQVVLVGVLNNNTGELFDTIQEAHDDPDTMNGHTIIISRGTYHENLVITKDISLLGFNKEMTIIDGGQSTINTVYINNTNAVTIDRLTIRNDDYGIYIDSSSNTIINDSIVTGNNKAGICLNNSNNVLLSNSTIYSNNPSSYGVGIIFDGVTDSIIVGNNITNNYHGILSDAASIHNTIYHNNFIDNIQNAYDDGNNSWDNGYPSAGNYWDDYTGNDSYYGPNQDIPGEDGVIDSSYSIVPGSINQDRYPFVNPWTGISPVPLPAITYVDDDYNQFTVGWGYNHFNQIQYGIYGVRENGTVLVYDGTYYENIYINKPLKLTGENKENTIINGNGQGNVIYLSADMAVISGFTIKNSGDSYTNAGIYLNSSSGNTLTDNIITENTWGLCFSGSSNGVISRNVIIDNKKYGLMLIEYSNYNEIRENIISNCSTGIHIFMSTNNKIYHNDFFNNSKKQAYIACGFNFFDNGYPSGGNYWDDYNGNDTDGDGIGDTPYNISGLAIKDQYPLIGSFNQAYIIDNTDNEFIIINGTWNSTDSLSLWWWSYPNTFNGEARYNAPGIGNNKAGWRVDKLVEPGMYKTYVWKFEHPYSHMMATNTHYSVMDRNGFSDWITVDQSAPGNKWICLGTFEFDNSSSQGILITDNANGYVVADAIKLVYTGPLT